MKTVKKVVEVFIKGFKKIEIHLNHYHEEIFKKEIGISKELYLIWLKGKAITFLPRSVSSTRGGHGELKE